MNVDEGDGKNEIDGNVETTQEVELAAAEKTSSGQQVVAAANISEEHIDRNIASSEEKWKTELVDAMEVAQVMMGSEIFDASLDTVLNFNFFEHYTFVSMIKSFQQQLKAVQRGKLDKDTIRAAIKVAASIDNVELPTSDVKILKELVTKSRTSSVACLVSKAAAQENAIAKEAPNDRRSDRAILRLGAGRWMMSEMICEQIRTRMKHSSKALEAKCRALQLQIINLRHTHAVQRRADKEELERLRGKFTHSSIEVKQRAIALWMGQLGLDPVAPAIDTLRIEWREAMHKFGEEALKWAIQDFLGRQTKMWVEDSFLHYYGNRIMSHLKRHEQRAVCAFRRSTELNGFDHAALFRDLGSHRTVEETYGSLLAGYRLKRSRSQLELDSHQAFPPSTTERRHDYSSSGEDTTERFRPKHARIAEKALPASPGWTFNSGWTLKIDKAFRLAVVWNRPDMTLKTAEQNQAAASAAEGCDSQSAVICEIYSSESVRAPHSGSRNESCNDECPSEPFEKAEQVRQ